MNFPEHVYKKITRYEERRYAKWRREHAPDLNAQRAHRFAYEPKISIVVPLYRTPPQFLKDMRASVQAQTYRNLELCEAETGLGIAENTNAGLKMTTGDYIAFMDHDDMLAEDALFEVVKAINAEPDTELFYSDEDKMSMDGRKYFMPFFKPDFNLDFLRSNNYICHLLVVKRSLLERVGEFDPSMNGAQDYDFILRCTEQTDRICHIPKILYHWRAHKSSTAENPESKEYAFTAGGRALEAHYGRLGIPATVEKLPEKGLYRTRYHYPAVEGYHFTDSLDSMDEACRAELLSVLGRPDVAAVCARVLGAREKESEPGYFRMNIAMRDLEKLPEDCYVALDRPGAGSLIVYDPYAVVRRRT